VRVRSSKATGCRMAAGVWEAWTKIPPLDVAPWLGGKRNLAKCICAIVDADRAHTTYAEPFVGMGGIFLRRSLRPKAEVINDFGRGVATLFRSLQRHYPQFLDVLRFQLITQTFLLRLHDRIF